MSKETFYIDGNRFSTLSEFLQEVSNVLIPGAVEGWIHGLDAFNDLLYRGENKPKEGFILVWKNSAESRVRLGYPETVRYLEKILLKCHPLNRPSVQNEILLAKQNDGPTVFDILVELIRSHDDIELILS